MEIDGTEVDDLLREWEKELDATRAELLQIDPLKELEKLEQEATDLLNALTADYNTKQLEELARDTDKELEALATEYAAEINKLLEGGDGTMNKAEADSLLHSIDNATMETAKDLMKRLLPAMKGGKWDAMTQIQKVCVLVAIAIRYGERRARHETAGSGTQGN